MTSEKNGSVGYGRPPVTTQFKPGVSGNPSGRPKSVRSLRAELLDELSEITRIHEGDSEIEISKARAIAKALVQAAVDGNLRATTALLGFFAKTLGGTDEPQSRDVAPEDAAIVDAFVGRHRSNSRDDDVSKPELKSRDNDNAE